MKHLLMLFVVFSLLLPLVACAQTKVVAGSSVIVAWNPPANVGTAAGQVPSSQVTYEVVIAPHPAMSPVTLVTTVSATEAVIVLPSEGAYDAGVRAKRTTPDGSVYTSPYAWSPVDGYDRDGVTPAPWYLSYYTAPDKVKVIRLK